MYAKFQLSKQDNFEWKIGIRYDYIFPQANQPFILIVRGNRDPSEYAAAMANDLKYRNQAPILESLPDYGPSTDQQVSREKQ